MMVCLSLSELQRIKQWHVAHRDDHPLEYQLWDTILILWVMGCIGWLPVFAFHAWWALPLCAVALFSPSTYVAWRARAHQRQLLRCDWLRSER
jgi:hypothetical protein